MPFFKTTENIFKDFGEYFDPNWMNYDTIQTPSYKKWDYKKELVIEDINLWEVIFEGGFGVYAAWDPYAEFYIIVPPYWENKFSIETYYGKNALNKLRKRMSELNLRIPNNQIWVDNEDMWLYTEN